MARIFQEAELMRAMSAAERKHPPPAFGELSKPVSAIAGVFGEMLYARTTSIEVTDTKLCDLISEFVDA